jgi:hypothetical protein
MLLLAYAAQAFYLASALPMDGEESRAAFGEAKTVWFAVHDSAAQPPGAHSPAQVEEPAGRPVSPVMRGIALAVPWRHLPGNPKIWLRLPMILAGMMLGLSVWSIGRRWYGAAGGLMALGIYSFSTSLVQAGARFAPDILAAWGIYGVVFTAMAIAHACYAAPGTVGRRSLAGKFAMFALALGVGAAAQPSWRFVLAVTLAFTFSLYLVRAGSPPRGAESARRPAVLCLLIRLLVALALGIGLLLVIYNVHWSELPAGWRLNVQFPLKREIFALQHWPMLAMLTLSLFAWLNNRRSRWFGNTAPLVAAVVFVAADSGFYAIPFAALFVAGVLADLLSSSPKWRVPVLVLLAANGAAGIWAVTQV